ncbi:hypothetical protein HUT19_32135 [Streptomyces sp. NA02950]|uniref:hypothetical protein n=1 Tax=Streptomyces sp. NA02950 TaxID=2742137 RepID=UPI00159033D9|nr:hypothetical protein [Streptomyces sp. NA02950]QKV95817.1 hypothetical protein HUT19_32135 [Streptomyces sp. NA02950]
MDRSRLDALAARFTGDGLTEREEVFRELRDLGMSPIETMYVASQVLRLPLPETKTALYESSPWRDQHEGWQSTQSSLGDGPQSG